MNRVTLSVTGFLSLVLTFPLAAQPPARGPGGFGQGPGERQQPPGRQQSGGRGTGGLQSPPWLAIFDADRDGTLSKAEIANASKALLKMDVNGDGSLTPDELGLPGATMGSRQGGMQGRGGPGQGPGPGPGSGPRQGAGPGEFGGPGARGGGNSDAAFAQELLTLDDDKDGMIQLSELPEHMHKAFAIADANQDGSLDDKERLSLAQQFRRNELIPRGESKGRVDEPKGGGRSGRPQ